MLTTTNQAVRATKADTLTTWRLPPVWPFIMNSRIDIGNTSTTTHTLFLWHTVRHLSEPPQNNLVKTHVGDIPCTLPNGPHTSTKSEQTKIKTEWKKISCIIKARQTRDPGGGAKQRKSCSLPYHSSGWNKGGKKEEVVIVVCNFKSVWPKFLGLIRTYFALRVGSTRWRKMKVKANNFAVNVSMGKSSVPWGAA